MGKVNRDGLLGELWTWRNGEAETVIYVEPRMGANDEVGD